MPAAAIRISLTRHGDFASLNIISLLIIAVLTICSAMQKPSVPPGKVIGMLVHEVSRLLRRRIDQEAQTIGLTSAQWRVLATVARAEMRGEDPPNQVTVADLMDMEPITLSRQIDRMQAAGLIERRPDPRDRRAYRLYLTEQSRPLVEKFRVIAGRCVGAALDGISEDEIARTQDVLNKIHGNLIDRPPQAEAALRETFAVEPIRKTTSTEDRESVAS